MSTVHVPRTRFFHVHFFPVCCQNCTVISSLTSRTNSTHTRSEYYWQTDGVLHHTFHRECHLFFLNQHHILSTLRPHLSSALAERPSWTRYDAKQFVDSKDHAFHRRQTSTAPIFKQRRMNGRTDRWRHTRETRHRDTQTHWDRQTQMKQSVHASMRWANTLG